MKNILLTLLILSFSSSLFSQTNEEKKEMINNTLKLIENAKSGNLIDAFGGFYQFAFKSISVNEKSLDLNSTLFSLVKNYDADILTTKSRKSIVFLRNFQVNAKMKLDENLNFGGYSGGFTYAILNERDKGFIDIEKTAFAPHITELNRLTNAVIVRVVTKEMSDFNAANHRNMDVYELKQLSDNITKVGTAIRNGKTVDSGLQKIYDDYVAELDTEINNSAYFKILRDEKGSPLTKSDEVNKYLQDSKNAFLKELEKKPFLSISSDGITDKDGKLNQASAGLVFLIGNKSGELDVRAKYNYADTLEISEPRSIFNGKIGYNLKLIKGKEEKSYFEIKAYGEYNKVLDGILTDEEEETILANADFRIRLTDDLWIPLTIKYDTKTSNFLGFLNVTYNFGD